MRKKKIIDLKLYRLLEKAIKDLPDRPVVIPKNKEDRKKAKLLGELIHYFLTKQWREYLLFGKYPFG